MIRESPTSLLIKISEYLKDLIRPRTERKIADQIGIEELLAALKDDDPEVRRQAAIKLGDLRDTKAVDDIIQLLNDDDDKVRIEAVIALGKIGNPHAIEPLIVKLKSDDYFYVRKKAAYTLYVFLKDEGLEWRLKEKILAHWRSWYLT